MAAPHLRRDALPQVEAPRRSKAPVSYFEPVEVLPETLISLPGHSGLPSLGMAMNPLLGFWMAGAA